MYEKERQRVLDCALQMVKYGLVALSGGNVGLRVGDDRFLVTPSAMDYDDMTADDVVVVTLAGDTVEGRRRPSSDMKALLHIFRHRQDVAAVIHTHQPYATAVGLVEDRLPACLVTILDANRGAVNVAPFTISSDEGMGVSALEHCGDSLAVILRNHGVIAFGGSLKEALHSAVYLEESAKCYAAARAMGGPIHLLTEEEMAAESAPRGNYGQ